MGRGRGAGRKEKGERERDVEQRWEGVREVDRGEADVWAHERVVGMEEKYEE
jgi:hypothetical protein